MQGVLLNDMLHRCYLNTISLGSAASGLGYTYISGNIQTTVDYIIADKEATSMLSYCQTRPMEDLNTSDHLPLIAEMIYAPVLEEAPTSMPTRIDWKLAVSSGQTNSYRESIANQLRCLTNNIYDNVEEIESELYFVSNLLCDAAQRNLPHVQPPKRQRWKDLTLASLCAQSSQARRVWREAGSPGEGPLYVEKCRLHRAVRKRVRFCSAQAENRRIQKRDSMFASNDKRHFRLPQSQKKTRTKLLVDGKIMEGKDSLQHAWSLHFQNLAKSRKEEYRPLQELNLHMFHLDSQSWENEDFILDTPVTIEEVYAALKKLKRGKSPGPDNLLAEHLLEGGEAVANWLMKIFNVIVTLEALPKSGIIVPVYKGSSKDPLFPGSYRGITLSSVVSKVLETVLLNRLRMSFAEASIPHTNQSPYSKGVSCSDATFATQEVIARYLKGGSRVFMCLYDLEKAFDSVDYPVLFDRLSAAGINGKCWRLLRNWYDGAR